MFQGRNRKKASAAFSLPISTLFNEIEGHWFQRTSVSSGRSGAPEEIRTSSSPTLRVLGELSSQPSMRSCSRRSYLARVQPAPSRHGRLSACLRDKEVPRGW
jgi:hypothetical protein